MAYDVGDQPVLTGNFVDIDGDAANPTVATLRVLLPDQTVVVVNHASLDNPSIGEWSYPFDITQEGEHWYRYEGTGAVTAAGEKMFTVRTRRVPVA